VGTPLHFGVGPLRVRGCLRPAPAAQQAASQHLHFRWAAALQRWMASRHMVAAMGRGRGWLGVDRLDRNSTGQA
jgi:hypothetical protein